MEAKYDAKVALYLFNNPTGKMPISYLGETEIVRHYSSCVLSFCHFECKNATLLHSLLVE